MNAQQPRQDADAFIEAARSFVLPPRPTMPHRQDPGRPSPWTQYGLPPKQVDLRTQGVLSAPKNQGLSYACTSFAVAAAAESAVLKESGRRVTLAPWHIHTCLIQRAENRGVYLDEALDAVQRRGIAFTQNSDTPWSDGQCASPRVQRLRGSIPVPHEQAAKQALAQGHVVVCVVIVEWEGFRRLGRGAVYRNQPSINDAQHTLCLVGYNDTQRSWLVLNSFGSGWCDDGFGLLAYHSCGLFDPATAGEGACLTA